MDIVDRYKFHTLTDEEKQELKKRGLTLDVKFAFIDKVDESLFVGHGCWCGIILLKKQHNNICESIKPNEMGYYFKNINIYERNKNYIPCFYNKWFNVFEYSQKWNKDNHKAIQLLGSKMPNFLELVFNIRQLCLNNDVCDDVIKYIITFI